MSDQCQETKVNRHHADFTCVKTRGHNGPHTTTDGRNWNHPSRGHAYGCPHPPNSPGGARGKTKPGCYWSKEPVKGWKGASPVQQAQP